MFVVFTHAELWLLYSFIKPATRHIGLESEGAQAQPGSTRVNEQLVDALLACEDSGLTEYTLELERDDLLLISYLIDPSFKTPEGASAKQILLKTFRARQELAVDGLGLVLGTEADQAYSDVKKKKSRGKEKDDASNSAGDDAGTNTDAIPAPE